MIHTHDMSWAVTDAAFMQPHGIHTLTMSG